MQSNAIAKGQSSADHRKGAAHLHCDGLQSQLKLLVAYDGSRARKMGDEWEVGEWSDRKDGVNQLVMHGRVY